jgi:hypothetical protein
MAGAMGSSPGTGSTLLRIHEALTRRCAELHRPQPLLALAIIDGGHNQDRESKCGDWRE